jgi:hypothetical protein
MGDVNRACLAIFALFSIESEIVPIGHAMVQGSVRIMDIELRVHWGLSRRWEEGTSNVIEFTFDFIQPWTMAIIDRVINLEFLICILTHRCGCKGIVVCSDVFLELLCKLMHAKVKVMKLCGNVLKMAWKYLSRETACAKIEDPS